MSIFCLLTLHDLDNESWVDITRETGIAMWLINETSKRTFDYDVSIQLLLVISIILNHQIFWLRMYLNCFYTLLKFVEMPSMGLLLITFLPEKPLFFWKWLRRLLTCSCY